MSVGDDGRGFAISVCSWRLPVRWSVGDCECRWRAGGDLIGVRLALRVGVSNILESRDFLGEVAVGLLLPFGVSQPGRRVAQFTVCFKRGTSWTRDKPDTFFRQYHVRSASVAKWGRYLEGFNDAPCNL